jgi:peptidoglycan L-alanyl-D-glutamate endopeptidase CwlK
LFPAFRDRYVQALADLTAYLDKHHPGMTCKLIEGFRTASYQNELYQKGRTTPGPIVTNRDGHVKRSNHQSSLAADVGVFKDGGAVYVDEPGEEIMKYYGHCLRAHDLKWGGDWKGSLVDEPHGEWDEADSQTYADARAWQATVGLA